MSISDCTQPTKVNDGYCNDETNIPECNYDGGDCCLMEGIIKKDHCSECACYHEETCIARMHPLVGDGSCNKETNIEVCMFDGQDCCEFESSAYVNDWFNFVDGTVANNSCSECECHGMFSQG